MTTWAEFRQRMRETSLNDVGLDVPRYSDALLLNAYSMALRGFASHTARNAIYTSEGFSGSSIPLPADSVWDFSSTAFFVVKDGETKRQLASSMDQAGVTPITKGGFFYVWGNTIYLQEELTDVGVEIMYYAHWVPPVENDDVLDIPAWSEPALIYLTSAHAIAGYAMNRTQLSQWAETPEKGSPEDNPFRRHHKWLIELYEIEIQRYPSRTFNRFA
jgi:hypothetical protein